MTSTLTPVNPETLAHPRGFSHGMKGRGDVLFVAGQVGWDREGRMVSQDFVGQFDQALQNVLEVVWAAGGGPENIGRFTIYVTDKDEYRKLSRQVGEAYRKRMGRHYPAMALVQVAALVEADAKVEIEATALV